MASSIVAARRLPGRSRSRFAGDGLAGAASSSLRRRASVWASSLARWAVARASVTLRELAARPLVGVDADWGGVPCALCAFFWPRGSFENIALCLLWGLWSAMRQAGGERGARQDVAKLRGRGVASSPRQDVTTGEAGCHPKMRQDVAAHLFTHHKTACLLTLSPLACHKAACSEPVKRRFRAWSGRRDSNPRQPAWKAGGRRIADRFLYIGLGGDFNAQIYISYGRGIGCCALV